jgi:hypothetical protein
MARPTREFVGYMFYEELEDKEKGITQNTCLAIKMGTHTLQRGEPVAQGIVTSDRGDIIEQLVSIQYLYDYCVKVPQAYAKSMSPNLFPYLKSIGASTRTVTWSKTHKISD